MKDKQEYNKREDRGDNRGFGDFSQREEGSRCFEGVELEVWGLQKRKEWVFFWRFVLYKVWGKINMFRIKFCEVLRLWGNTGQ